MRGTYGPKHKRLTSCATRTIIFQRENLNHLIPVSLYHSRSVLCFFQHVCFLFCQYFRRALLSVENVCNETSRQKTTDRMPIKKHVLAKQNRSPRQSRCVVLNDSLATGRVKTCTEILELSLARLISLLFLSICNCFMC